MHAAPLQVVLQDEQTRPGMHCCTLAAICAYLSHHMVCIHAVAFCHAPLKLILVQRGKVPIVVGGTGLYLRWLVHGRPQTPKSEPTLAARAQEALDQVVTVPPCGICMS